MPAREPVGIVSDLWRYPVKSFGGERLRAAFVGPFGVLGDRRHAVMGEDGHAISARRKHAMLAFKARYSASESAEGIEVVAPGDRFFTWDDPSLAERLSRALDQGVTLARSAAALHDAAPVHIVTTASLAAAAAWTPGEDIDVRRFRPNVVIEPDGREPDDEGSWPGRTLAVGDAGPRLAIVSPTERCAVTTIEPDTLERDDRVLAGLARDRENLFGVYARVVRPGWIRVGDAVHAVPAEGSQAPTSAEVVDADRPNRANW